MLIGLAELVPGVSGGTIALISGIYEPLINSASHVVSAVKRVVTGKFSEAGVEFRKVRWGIVIPALLGMAIVVVAMAGVMRVFVEDTPQLAHALFFGMVLASVVVPVMEIRPEDRHTGAQKGILAGLFAVAAVAAFFLTGLGAGSVIENPPAWMIFGSAAIAICALVLPGISGSFMLKIFGLYVPTMAAVADRNFGYLALTNAIEDRNRADRAGSILVLVGSINVPIIYFSVNLWNTLHQGSSVNPVSGSKMATVMLLAMLLLCLTIGKFAWDLLS